MASWWAGAKRLSAAAKQVGGAPEDAAQHGGREAAGVRVLAARVIRGHHHRAPGSIRTGRTVDAAVLEHGRGRGQKPRSSRSFQSRRTQCDRGRLHAQARQGRRFIAQLHAAVDNLARQRLVARRRAADDRGNPHVPPLEAVVPAARKRLVGEARRVHRGHEKVPRASGAVSREQTAGAIGAMGPRAPDPRRARARVGRRSPAPACPSSCRGDRRRVSRARRARSSGAAEGSARRRRWRRGWRPGCWPSALRPRPSTMPPRRRALGPGPWKGSHAPRLYRAVSPGFSSRTSMFLPARCCFNAAGVPVSTRERAPVDRHHLAHAEPVGGDGRGVRAHGEEVANRQERNLRRVEVAQDLHVAEERVSPAK